MYGRGDGVAVRYTVAVKQGICGREDGVEERVGRRRGAQKFPRWGYDASIG